MPSDGDNPRSSLSGKAICAHSRRMAVGPFEETIETELLRRQLIGHYRPNGGRSHTIGLFPIAHDLKRDRLSE